MTVVDFIERKNELVFEATGYTLVPSDQIVEVVKMPLNLGTSDAEICPYCALYIEEDFERDACEGCPMEKAANRCGVDTGNTYSNIQIDLGEGEGIISFPGVEALVDLYNKENGFKGMGEE